MSTRRHFLLSALLLPSALAAPTLAQTGKTTTPTATTATTVFADFENGYDDWTIEGDAFGARPATDALFPGKIKGFGGRGYASTFHPRRGVLATGRAISREFVIDRPVITFKIGGGNFPGLACLNLVVDGKIARTETGDGTAQLRAKLWDVSALLGKRAHLEIVDSTQSEQRGYIMVDDIVFVQSESLSSASGFLPVIEIPLRIIHALSSLGEAEFFGGDRTVLTYLAATRQVQEISKLYKSAGIVFTIAADDFETRKDDYLNLDSDAPSSYTIPGKQSNKPHTTGNVEHYRVFDRIAKERTNRLTILVHRGSEWRWDSRSQSWTFGVGHCWGGTLGSQSARISSTRPRVWAHELGHTLGLPHTSKDGVDAPSNLKTDDDISRVCQEYLDKGGNIEHPEYAIDGDQKAGVTDTPPDPGIGFWGNSKRLTASVTLNLRDRAPQSILVSRDNIMAANSDNGVFTPSQIAVMRRVAQQWKDKSGLN